MTDDMKQIYVVTRTCISCDKDFTYEKANPRGRKRSRCDECLVAHQARKIVERGRSRSFLDYQKKYHHGTHLSTTGGSISAEDFVQFLTTFLNERKLTVDGEKARIVADKSFGVSIFKGESTVSCGEFDILVEGLL